MVTTRALTLDELLEEAAQAIERLTPREAFVVTAQGAALVDVRGLDARARDGVVPGSYHIPRTVLEWRLDPEGHWRTPHLDVTAQDVVLLCDHGYSTQLAAATLTRLGVRVADVIGGFEAWRDAGLPTRAAGDAPLGPHELPGMRPPQ